MTSNLRTRLTFSYVLVALLCVLLVSVLANGVLERSFRSYVQSSLETRNHQIADQIAAKAAVGGAWDTAGISAIGMDALDQGMIVKVKDLSGRIIWDATLHNNGLCEQMISHMAQNMASRYRNWRGAYTENLYPVRTGFTTVGSVSIGFYGPFFLNDEDLSFINALNRLLALVALVALAAAICVGILMARGITVPLARVVAATQGIAGGKRDILLTGKTGVRELDRIASAVNELSRSLGEQESLRRRLTSDMAHELRTPLATLQSHLEALIDGVWEPDQARLTGLHEEILRINRMVRDLENLDRYESHEPALKKVETEIGQLVSGIVRNHEPQFRARRVVLSFKGTDGATAPVDPDRLSQAIINLLANALDFTPAGGTVEVSAAAKANGIEICVADTGVGIGFEDLPHIFDRFYKADPSRSRTVAPGGQRRERTGGSGIGLSITKAIVEAHGGTITARSAPGKGSTFTILLPAR
ncbi:MAG: HAMP domain-containing sensor histidine kinase [Spirochaetia bacterium]|jgi:signal transduction histidine kinase